jgi:indole-3-glycerol phosphate synthase
MNYLSRILADKRREIAARIRQQPLADVQRRAARAARAPSFLKTLTARPMGLIAEVKRRSPSAGIIRDPFHPARIAEAYEAAGAGAISVLMDRPYFGGGEEDFVAVREAVKLPLLYKEFVVDPWQVYHARALGASALLLIVAALPREQLASLLALAGTLGLEPLVEVHDARELGVAVAVGARCIGVNNRNLKTFVTTLDTTYRLARKVPAGTVLVSESGIGSAEDVVLVKRAGARAVLVGEHLLRQRNLRRAVRNLMGRAWASS